MATPGLLDSYQRERHAVGRLVLRMSGGLLRLTTLPSAVLPVARALTATAVRVPPLAHRAAGLVSGIAIHYPRPAGAHHLVGRRAPDLRLSDGSRLYEVLRDGRFVLVTTVDAGLDPQRVHAVRPADEPTPALLVRPDGYIAWATDRPDPAAVRTGAAAWIAR